ncbi:CPBP family intramembrane glutamic endopeptidase [Haloarcula onubensis]|uniref:CPBP family intramembrane metalloprotease n=1 Tax=Haloarcula onubensis TaxID=2950539 RepID=A0ABU2FWC0_9EURY|nr:type II CAAX endopeptidase family protein [Halomicroarcula sp. S3CR25-11]MDS0284451.1 CPBP family intramembrane metalloprotease [Halomicroarcula sp. S3CR25-11]
MKLRTHLWNHSEDRLRAPVRLVGGFFLIALLAVVGTVLTDVLAAVLWPSIPSAYYLVVTTVGLALGAVFGVVVVARTIDRRSLHDYGFRGGLAWWRDLFVGITLAVFVQAVVLGVELATGWAVVTDTTVASGGFVTLLVASVVLFAVVGFYEELVLRGVVLKNVAEGLAGRGAVTAVTVAVLVSSLLFGVIHLSNGGASLVSVSVIGFIALTVAASYVLTGRLGFAIGFHAGWNIAMGVLFGQPVSGITVPARVLAVDVTGPSLWTGGAFGPEAGLLGVAAGFLGLLGVLVYTRVVEGNLRIHPDILVPGRRVEDSVVEPPVHETGAGGGTFPDEASVEPRK